MGEGLLVRSTGVTANEKYLSGLPFWRRVRREGWDRVCCTEFLT